MLKNILLINENININTTIEFQFTENGKQENIMSNYSVIIKYYEKK